MTRRREREVESLPLTELWRGKNKEGEWWVMRALVGSSGKQLGGRWALKSWGHFCLSLPTCIFTLVFYARWFFLDSFWTRVENAWALLKNLFSFFSYQIISIPIFFPLFFIHLISPPTKHILNEFNSLKDCRLQFKMKYLYFVLLLILYLSSKR